MLVTLPLTNVIAEDPEPLSVENSDAADEKSMQAYDEVIEHTEATVRMIPIRGGEFLMGSPESEADRKEDEGPQHKVKIDAFWMAECEIAWDAYEVWMYDLDIQRRKRAKQDPNQRDIAADEYQLTQPTEPYMNMDFGMGRRGYPAICMTQLAARTFCDWLSAKTGRYYRLPTEAEWEYACRAGTTTAYSWGDSIDDIDDFAWYYENSSEKYQKIKKKKPNPWGLYDMHGNVSEWVLDQYDEGYYARWTDKVADNPLLIPTTLYPRVVRGGNWDDDADALRSAARVGSDESWKQQDPQIPKSIWYHTDATGVGFRIIRPLNRPSESEIKNRWGKSEPVQERKAGRI
jgi:formylglycine-generating enzyme required for sulfatase activity